MSIRVRVLLIIFFIVAAITATTLVTSLFFVRSTLEQTVESDLSVIASIADKLISSEINLLKANASMVAYELQGVSDEDLPWKLREQVETSIFMALTVFDRKGILLEYGKAPTPATLLNSRYMRQAFAGQEVISTTRQDPSGELVFHVCVPMWGDRVLSGTVSGLIFRDLLASYKIWDTGTVFILDAEGTVLANERTYMVLERYNAIEAAKTDPEARSSGAFCSRMIRGGKGVGKFELFGVERLAAYASVSGSNVGWVLGVSAPLSESPAAHVDRGLLLAGLIFLGLASIAALFASDFIARPFKVIKEQNEHLAELNAVAQSASQAKSRFLANMSHEMRTPLNAIIGFSKLILSGHSTPDERTGNMEKIHAAGMTLLGIVNDILDISKIESGKFDIIPVEYELASLINDTITLNIVRIGERPIQFRLRVDETLPGLLIGDELRIKQICNNLLSNAFKYTLEGTVELGVSGEREGESLWLSIRVRDTGIGIRPEDMEKLFSDYSQVNARSNRNIEGTGLGLSITRKMVEMMDGAITVESEYGRGSVFTARFRQRITDSPPIGAAVVESLKNFQYLRQNGVRNGSMAITPLPYARVLVVDDVSTNLDVVRGMLKPYGLQVDCVSGGREAVARIRAEQVRYNAIFMDHMMPGMDGIEAVRVIREEIGTEYARTVPVIALTANAILGNERMFLEHGFQAFLSKPIDILRLDSTLEQWVRDKELEKEYMKARGKETERSEAAESPGRFPPERLRMDGLDLEEALARLGGDRNSLLQVLRSYAANTPALLESMRLPDESGLLEYTIIVHGVKSSSYGIGAKELGKKAEDLERAAQSADFDFIGKNNAGFVEDAEKLIAALSALLESLRLESGKPEKEAPDPGVLERLREACSLYDMDGVDRVMAELESFTYAREPELPLWLRERVDRMDFQQIMERLSAC
ncbi:MAG: response regulator [Deltaproteobacteria bacterium]|jgi:signal transduction histidine kinase|nr:response regulator [Deltaproteobacteria bacterium]